MFDITQTITRQPTLKIAPKNQFSLFFAFFVPLVVQKYKLFMQNKPNFKKHKMMLTPYNTKDYKENYPSPHCKNEPKTNPIQSQTNPIIAPYNPYNPHNPPPTVIDFNAAKQRASEELSRIEEITNNLLDNLTSENRELVNKRLRSLKQQKQNLETRLQELDRLQSSQDEIQNIVSQALKFIASLEYTFQEGLPQEKLVALRQCIKKISINKPAGEIKLYIRLVPAGDLQATGEFKWLFDGAFGNANPKNL